MNVIILEKTERNYAMNSECGSLNFRDEKTQNETIDRFSICCQKGRLYKFSDKKFILILNYYFSLKEK